MPSYLMRTATRKTTASPWPSRHFPPHHKIFCLGVPPAEALPVFPPMVRLSLSCLAVFLCPPHPACPAYQIPPPTCTSIPQGAGSGGGQAGPRERQRQTKTQPQTTVPLTLTCADCPHLCRPTPMNPTGEAQGNPVTPQGEGAGGMLFATPAF